MLGKATNDTEPWNETDMKFRFGCVSVLGVSSTVVRQFQVARIHHCALISFSEPDDTMS